jgi:TetR/AcrR family transcriptional regulator, transcriptional repressor for nem operon
MARTETRAAIVGIASQLLRVNGFDGTGIDAVLKQAGVPKGSFYHYFRSKDELGMAIIEDAARELAAKLEKHLDDATLTPLRRLRGYFESGIVAQRRSECTRGCLFGTLGLELASKNARLRRRIAEEFMRWKERVVACLKQAQQAGELSADHDTAELAGFILSAWEGAILRAKVAKSVEPLQQCVDLLFRRVLS